MNPTLLSILTFAAAAMAVAAAASLVSDLFLRDRARVGQRIDDEFRQRQRQRAQRSSLFKDLDRISSEVATRDNPPLRLRLETLLDQAGLEMSVERLLITSLVLTLVGGVGGFLLRNSLIVGGIAGLVGGVLPYLYVLLKRRKRLDTLRLQLPDAFELMSRVVRAGQTISQAQQAVADEFAPPLAGEFSICYEQQNLGLPPDVALQDLARRTGVLEIQIFVTAMLVQQQSGGNLSELLERLAGTVRERIKMRSKIKALTAEGRFQGLVLLFLPVGLYLIMLAMNREFAVVLLDYPQVLLGAAVSEAIGAFWISRIVNFDF